MKKMAVKMMIWVYAWAPVVTKWGVVLYKVCELLDMVLIGARGWGV